MKQLLLLLIISIIYLNSIGQLTKNNWLFGGSGSFYSYNETYASPAYNTTAKYTNIDVSASVGYFIVDKLVGGLRPTFSSFKGLLSRRTP